MERKKRYTPPKETKKLSPRKSTLDALQVIYEQELVRSTIIEKLLPQRHDRGLKHSLRTLFDAGLVAKPQENNNNIYLPDVYYLTPAGERFLFQYIGTPRHVVRTYRPREDYRIEYHHKLGISDTLGNIRAGLFETPCRFISQGEIEANNGKHDDEPLKLPVNVGCQLNGKWQTWSGDLVPDGLFGIEYPDATKSYFALEYQRTGKVRTNTLLGISSMRRKYLGYANAYAQKAYKAHWGIGNLKVLFVFTQEVDYRASVKLCEEMFPDGSPMFYHAFIPAHSLTPSGMVTAPKPFPEIAMMKWTRAGQPERAIYEPE